MPGYLPKAFLRFNHLPPKKKQNSPHPHIAPQYGAKTQYTADKDDSPFLNKEETKYIQAVAGVSMYVDPLRYSRPSLFSSSLYHHV